MEQVKDKDEIIKDLRAKLELANVTINQQTQIIEALKKEVESYNR